jgi:hypothetical protein
VTVRSVNHRLDDCCALHGLTLPSRIRRSSTAISAPSRSKPLQVPRCLSSFFVPSSR